MTGIVPGRANFVDAPAIHGQCNNLRTLAARGDKGCVMMITMCDSPGFDWQLWLEAYILVVAHLTARSPLNLDNDSMITFTLVLAALIPTQDSNSNATELKKDVASFTASGHIVDSLDIVKKRLKAKEAVLIDVREPQEWQTGHLKDAKLVPMSAVKAQKLTDEMKKNLPKDKPIYCHCRSGGRVLIVSKLLREQGYDIRPLAFGYSKLVEAGFKKAETKK